MKRSEILREIGKAIRSGRWPVDSVHELHTVPLHRIIEALVFAYTLVTEKEEDSAASR